MRKHTLAFVDIEMTGFDPDIHEIIEIGVVLVEQDWSSEKPIFKIKEEFELKIKPTNIETADKISLKINKYNEKDWENALNLKDALIIFKEKTQNSIMIAHNLYQDAIFLDKAFKNLNIKNEMHYLRIDSISMAFAKLNGNKDIEKYSLYNLCDYFNIKNENAHSALSDARALYQLYEKLLNI